VEQSVIKEITSIAVATNDDANRIKALPPPNNHVDSSSQSHNGSGTGSSAPVASQHKNYSLNSSNITEYKRVSKT